MRGRGRKRIGGKGNEEMEEKEEKEEEEGRGVGKVKIIGGREKKK